jgi:hypothetical protein
MWRRGTQKSLALLALRSVRRKSAAIRTTKNWLNVFSFADDKYEYELRDCKECLVAATFPADEFPRTTVGNTSRATTDFKPNDRVMKGAHHVHED